MLHVDARHDPIYSKSDITEHKQHTDSLRHNPGMKIPMSHLLTFKETEKQQRFFFNIVLYSQDHLKSRSKCETKTNSPQIYMNDQHLLIEKCLTGITDRRSLNS